MTLGTLGQPIPVVKGKLVLEDGTEVPVMVTGGEFLLIKQAYYSQWDLDTNVMPEPAVIAPIEQAFKMQVVAINDPKAIEQMAVRLGGLKMINIETRLEGLR